MARERIMDEAKRCTIVIDQWMYDVAKELVVERVHTSISDVIRKALKDYLDSMEEYVELSREENRIRDESMETGIGRDINGNMIYIPTYRLREWEQDGDIDKAIERHITLTNAMLDPSFFKE